MIQKLRMTESALMKTKKMLTKKRDHFLNTIAPATGVNTELCQQKSCF